MSGGEIGCPVAGTSQQEQMLLEKKILGQEGFGPAVSEEFGEAGQEGGKEEGNDIHAAECGVGER